MNTNEIYSFLTNMLKGCNATYDVIPCDHLKHFKVTKYPLCLCVNNEPSILPGEHWVGIFINKPESPLEFFCSYGLKMKYYPKYFLQFAKRLKKRVVETRVQLQGLRSNVCGQYVICFLYKRHLGCSLVSFYEMFSNNQKSNDAFVSRFVSSKNHLLKSQCKKAKVVQSSVKKSRIK
jgi:hypothetical protein